MLEFRRTIRSGVLYLEGSDTWQEWVHHFIPGARRREIEAAKEIVEYLEASSAMIHTVAGHSLGGAVATIVAAILFDRREYPVSLKTFGGKRPPLGYSYMGAHYRRRGDIVPGLPPWRPAVRCVVFGERLPFWEAHQPRSYYSVMEQEGVR